MKHGSDEDKQLLAESNAPADHRRNPRISKKRQRIQRDGNVVPRRAARASQ